MLKLYSLAIVILLGITLPISVRSQAPTVKFAWPDGASAKVHVRSVGRRVSNGKPRTWDMSSDFTMALKLVNGRIVVSRSIVSDWKGTLPPSFGGGAERFAHMVPTVVVTESGQFVGIEGHETARKLMANSVEQSGGLPPLERTAFQTVTSNASLEAIVRDQWSYLVVLWQDVELDAGVSYELRNVTPVPQLGGGELEIKGAVGFIKETPCESPLNDRRCVHFHAETAASQEQVRKLIQALLLKADPRFPPITAFEQQFKLDIVVEKTTMLPQYLKVTRIHNLTVKEQNSSSDSGSEEYSTTFTFAWTLPAKKE